MILSQDTLTVALVALLVDAAFGWPEALFRRLSHPVVWIGRLIDALDARWNRLPAGPRARRRAGRVLLGGLAVAVVLAAGLVWWTGTRRPDLVVAFAVAGLFLQSAWAIIRDARRDLSEAKA